MLYCPGVAGVAQLGAALGRLTHTNICPTLLAEVIATVVQTTALGGNSLINVGPARDGTIGR